MKNFNLQPLGGGAGLRHAHFAEIIEKLPAFNWFEIITEDFMGYGGWEREALFEIRKHYQIIGHSVCMSLGSTDPLDPDYLKRLRTFLKELRTPWTSDHLCFTMVDHTNLNELIPLPFTHECVTNVVNRIRTVQDTLELPFLVENVTRYLTISDRELSECEFICEVLEGADCGLLLDLTNVYLNSQYHGYDAYEFVASLPLERVGQIHVAGSEPSEDGSIIDSHDAPVAPEVWDLLRFTLKRTGPTSILVEWDKSLPPVERLLLETQMADKLIAESIKEAA